MSPRLTVRSVPGATARHACNASRLLWMSLRRSMRNDHRGPEAFAHNGTGMGIIKQGREKLCGGVHDRTSCPMADADFHERGKCTSTLGQAEFATRLKQTARGHSVQWRHRAFNSPQRVIAIGGQGWRRSEQAARIRMRGRVKDIITRTNFD